MMKIQVKEVIGYEGLYLIDTLGNVISMPKKNGSRIVNEYYIMKTKINRLGYKEVALSKNGETKTVLLHRLIAKHFVENPDNLKVVNHKNGIKTDNRLENLEWCTTKQNTKHAYENNLGGFKISANEGIKKMNYYTEYVKVILVDSSGKEYHFNSSSEAAKFANTNNNEVTRAIRKEQRVKGYKAYGLKRQCANGEA